MSGAVLTEPRTRFEEGDAFREGWKWRRPVARWFRDQTMRLDLPRPLVHVCSGSSRLGEVRMDAAHPRANLRGDAFAMPLKTGSVGTAIYDGVYEWTLPQRVKVCQELARVVRPGGLLLWKQRFLPLEGLFRIEETWVSSRRVGMPRDVDLLVRARRRVPGKNVRRGIMSAAERRAKGVC